MSMNELHTLTLLKIIYYFQSLYIRTNNALNLGAPSFKGTKRFRRFYFFVDCSRGRSSSNRIESRWSEIDGFRDLPSSHACSTKSQRSSKHDRESAFNLLQKFPRSLWAVKTPPTKYFFQKISIQAQQSSIQGFRPYILRFIQYERRIDYDRYYWD